MRSLNWDALFDEEGLSASAGGTGSRLHSVQTIIRPILISCCCTPRSEMRAAIPNRNASKNFKKAAEEKSQEMSRIIAIRPFDNSGN